MGEKAIQVDDKDQKVKEKRSRPSGSAIFPRDPLKKVLKLAESIEKNNAGKPYNRLDIAASINASPNSSSFRQLIISSGRYNLTEGGYAAEKIALTPLGSSIVAPTREGQAQEGLKQALLSPDLFKKVFEYYDKKMIPREELFKNTLKKEFNVAPEDIDVCYEIIMTNLKDYNLIQNIKNNDFLQLDKLSSAETAPIKIHEEGEIEKEILIEPEMKVEKIEEKKTYKQIFVAHGKNRVPLNQLEKILNKFKVPYRVAEEEPNRGLPIGLKVAELMKECTSGIFIFTADEETQDLQGNKVFRPSDNVVYELGAASVLYGNKIVILKETDVSFASDFNSIGYISFEKDRLDTKAADLMVELISLGFLQVTPT